MYLKRERVRERKGEVSVLAHTVYSRINAHTIYNQMVVHI